MDISHQVNASHIYHISSESYFHLIKVINSLLNTWLCSLAHRTKKNKWLLSPVRLHSWKAVDTTGVSSSTTKCTAHPHISLNTTFNLMYGTTSSIRRPLCDNISLFKRHISIWQATRIRSDHNFCTNRTSTERVYLENRRYFIMLTRASQCYLLRASLF